MGALPQSRLNSVNWTFTGSDVVDFEFVLHLDLCDLGRVRDLGDNLLFGLFLLLALKLSSIFGGFGFVCGGFEGLGLGFLLFSDHFLLLAELRSLFLGLFGLLLGFLITVLLLAVLARLEPVDELGHLALHLFLGLAVAKDVVLVKLFLA